MRYKILSLLAAAFSLGFAQAASAADMPAKAPVYKAPPAAAINWTGFYINGGYGYGVWSADTTTQFTGGPCVVCVNQEQGGKGWLGVIGLGYDYQFAPSFLAGVFGDYNFSSLKGSVQDPLLIFEGDIKQTSAWAVGGRLGWLVTPDFLAYVNGGYSSAHFSGTTLVSGFTGAPSGVSTPGFDAHGWFVGGGTETTMNGFLGVFGPGWFWRNEYRYANYSNQTVPEVGTGLNINFKPVVQTVTSELVYKLNTGGPAYRIAAPVAPANWTGIYVNGGVGYGVWAADTTTQFTAGVPVCILCVNQEQGGRGWLGVAGLGYDYQLMPKIVVGVFGDYDISSLKGSIVNQIGVQEGDIKQTSAWAAGGRAGWLVTPQILSYVNGGYTSARFSGTTLVVSTVGVPNGLTTPAFTTNGWFLGGGAEVAIAPGWFWRNEYRYASYSNRTIPEQGSIIGINFKPVVQTFTTQAVYKFNWPG
jgi:outer membrane immunogenic protein